ncbi:c-type cytochrome [Aliiglaciecola sp. LCG003]|uniref:c-type cytochrome n=1 Tax=Aliiglaciecola sp. LCG003 TaxID=3053655 RepID=UPI0025726B48|nr:c-type cytochrome [Aliiglaciecola sp. LCG003]WJG07691.1 c-type cytochrome [Aliiglaciecola sp. LCG003]
MNLYKIIMLLMLSTLMWSCDSGVSSPTGFSLPEGDETKGQAVFMQYQCLACHNIEGIKDENIALDMEPTIKLGGSSPKVTTYAQLVTSIINPSHKISRRHPFGSVDENGKSKMTNINDALTVSELIDLVAFLQPHYKVKPNYYTPYGQYQVP